MTQSTDFQSGRFKPPNSLPFPESHILELVIQDSPDFIGISDTSGRPIYVNAAAMKMVGLSWSEMLETKVSDYFVPEDRAFVAEVVLPAVQHDGRWIGELTFRHFKTGARIPVLYNVFRIDDPGTGKPTHFATITRDLRTEKVREAELHDARQRVSFVQAATELGTWTYEITTGRVVADSQLLELFGLEDSGVEGRPLDSFLQPIHAEDRTMVQQRIEDTLRDGTDFSAEYRVIPRVGSPRYIISRGKLERDEAGRPVRMPGVVLDVTERVRAEQSQRELSAQITRQAGVFDALLSAITDYAFIFDRETRVVFANRALLELWHLPLKEVVGKTMVELGYPPALAEKLWTQMRQVMDTRLPIMDRTEYTDPNGKLQVHEYIYAPVLDPDGSVNLVAGSSRDITERQHFVDALERSEKRLRMLADSVPQKVWMTSADGSPDYFNRRWYEFTKLPEGASDGERWLDVVHPEDRARAMNRWHQSVQSGEPYENEFRLRHHSGQFRWVLSRALAIRNELGEIERWFGSCTDIHAQRQAAEALREGREQLTLAVEAGQLGTWNLNLQTLELQCSDRCKAYFGFPFETELSYLDLKTKVHPEDLSGVETTILRALELKEQFTTEYRVKWHDGSEHWLSTRGRYHCDEITGTRLVGVTTDITERKHSEAQRDHLLEAERAARAEAERVGKMKDEFLATLSHELRTPLNAIFGWTQLLKAGVDDPAEVNEAVDVIDRNVRVQIRLIEDLLDMSRVISGKLRLDVQKVSPVTCIQSAIETLTPAADAKHIRLEKDLPPSAAEFMGDPARLQQVMWNILSNAIKFTPTGGSVQVNMRCASDSICITVRDSGTGIAHEFLPHIFDRFRQADAATNRKFGGLGLGMAISKQLVELHGGTIRAESEGLGKGATFTVCLPTQHCVPSCSSSPLETSRLTFSADPGSGVPDLSGISILIVDDEPDAREFLRRILTDCGANARVAANALEGMAALNEGPIDLLITDIGMPEIDGYEFLRLARTSSLNVRNHSIPVIAVTAFARADDRSRVLASGFAAHVSKPVDSRQLAEVIVATLKSARN